MYKVRAGYQLLITTGPEIHIGVISETTYPTRVAARAAAKLAGAKFWNCI
jgi:hypothetical protein